MERDGRGWRWHPARHLAFCLPILSSVSHHQRPPLHRCVHVSPGAFLSIIHTFCIQQTDATWSPTRSRSGGINGPLTLVGLGPLARRLELMCPKHWPAELMWAQSEKKVMTPWSHVPLNPYKATARGTQGPGQSTGY